MAGTQVARRGVGAVVGTQSLGDSWFCLPSLWVHRTLSVSPVAFWWVMQGTQRSVRCSRGLHTQARGRSVQVSWVLGAAVWVVSTGGKSLSSWSLGRNGGPCQVVGLTYNNGGYREQMPVCRSERRKATLESGQPSLSQPCCSSCVTLGWLMSWLEPWHQVLIVLVSFPMAQATYWVPGSSLSTSHALSH